MRPCRVVSGVLVDSIGKILMGKRPMGKRRGGLWELPGGKLDEGEDPKTALAREWLEELGIAVVVGDFIASAVLQMEIPLFIDLYEVRRVGSMFDMVNNAHDEIAWKDSVHMMEYEPCSPAYYAHYPWLAAWLKARC
jgi:8-oxo-dGTP diphosphatase